MQKIKIGDNQIFVNNGGARGEKHYHGAGFAVRTILLPLLKGNSLMVFMKD